MLWFPVIGVALMILATWKWWSQRRRVAPVAAGERNVVDEWLAAAHVDEPVSQAGRVVLALAAVSIRARRIDVVKSLLDELDELSRAARARLLQAAEGRMMILDALEGPLPSSEELRLIEVGIEPGTRTFEFTGYFTAPGTRDDDAFVTPDALHAMLRDHRDRAGNPIDDVRVVFWEEQLARRARRALGNTGASVFYMDDQGDLVQVEAATLDA